VSALRASLNPISRRGRAAALTVGGTLVIGGPIAIAGGWAEFWCALGGRQGSAICDYLSAFASLFVLGGTVATLIGIFVIVRALLRPGPLHGSSGWTWGEGILIWIAGISIALLIPSYTCPPGYRATVAFALCVSDADRVDATSMLGRRLAVAVTSVLLGLIVARWERLPRVVASFFTVSISATALVYLLSKTVGVPW
jgi:hypothetical protein